MSAEERIKDQIDAIMRQESTPCYSTNFDYFAVNGEDNITGISQVDDSWRRRICEWLFNVVDHFNFEREVVLITLNYLDRAASIETKKLGKGINPREYQLIGITCFYIAMKLHGEPSSDINNAYRGKLKTEAFVELSHGLLTIELLEDKEREILQMLEWRVNPPLASTIIAYLLHFLPNVRISNGMMLHSKAEIYELSSYLLQLGVSVSSIMFNYRPSEIAYACILCAFDALQTKVDIPYENQVQFIRKVLDLTRSLSPRSVASLKEMFKSLNPSMFQQEASITFFPEKDTESENASPIKHGPCEYGKESPVCVMDQVHNNE